METMTSEELCKCRSTLIHIAKRRGVPDSSASDLAQSALCKTLKQDTSQYTVGYLVTVLKNKIVDRFRRKSQAAKLCNKLAALPSVSMPTIPDAIIEQSEEAAFFKELFPLFNQREKEIFQLYYVQGRKRAEVIEIMNITPGALANSLRTIDKKTELAKTRCQPKNDSQ